MSLVKTSYFKLEFIIGYSDDIIIKTSFKHTSNYLKQEFPPEEDVTQDETEIMEDNEDLDDSASKNEKSIKRKAQSQTNAKSKVSTRTLCSLPHRT